jgi:hypothetical protein
LFWENVAIWAGVTAIAGGLLALVTGTVVLIMALLGRWH